MAERLLIKNGRLIDPAQKVEAQSDLLLEDGKVAQVGVGLKVSSARTIEAKGKVVTPGFIDLHVHLRTPGQEHKETIETGSRAAVKGGFTTICTMANTDPPVDSVTVVEYLKAQNQKVGLVNILPYAAVTVGLKGETLTEMGELQGAGVVGFSDDGMPVMNAGVMRRALEYSRMTGLPVISHCEDKNLTGNGVAHEGTTAARLGLAGIPAEAETVMIARDLLLAQGTGGRLHIAHVSTAKGVELIRTAKKKGVAVSAEVAPHHLTLSDEVLTSYDARFKMNPPLRTKEDLAALVEGLQDGTLDAVATDHAPHAVAEKEAELAQAPFGVIGLETAFAVLISRLVAHGRISLSALIEAMTIRPARALGLRCGRLAPGDPADVTIVDPEAEWTVEATTFASKGVNSPFLGWRVKGKVTDVLVGGKAVLVGGQFVNERASV